MLAENMRSCPAHTVPDGAVLTRDSVFFSVGSREHTLPSMCSRHCIGTVPSVRGQRSLYTAMQVTEGYAGYSAVFSVGNKRSSPLPHASARHPENG